MKIAVLLGRVLYSFMFLLSGIRHIAGSGVEQAAKQGLPMASLLVPAAGALAFLGALSILIGYKARFGAWLLVVFLIPVTLVMHRFWGIPDPAMAQMQFIHFMKNVSLLGASLMIAYFGSGPLSVDRPRLPLSP